jgi:hypothetical protein
VIAPEVVLRHDNLKKFQTEMLLGARETFEVLQNLHQDQLQIRVLGQQNIGSLQMRTVLHGSRTINENLWLVRHEVLQESRGRFDQS